MTALLLLLCQAAFAAQICAQQAAARVDGTGPSCHHAADSQDSTVPATATSGGGCEAPALTGHAVDMPLLAVTALPALLIYTEPMAAALGRARDVLALEPHCRPPPLSILHCRFLI